MFAPKQSNSENGEVFSSCSNLTFVPNFTFTGSTASLYQAFRYCSSLQAVGDIIRPNATSGGTADNMFEQDAALKSVGIIDMRGITSASGMFSGCNAIQSVTLSNTTALANANNMFYNCKSLQSINIPNTSSLTSVSGMFKSAYPTASVCTSISAFDTSNVTNFSSMFEAADSTVYSGASRFTTAPSLDMSSATDVSFMFKTTNTSNGWLTTIPQYDWGNVENVSSVFYNQTDLQNLGGFINLGKSFKGTSSSQHKLTFKGQIASYIADITKQSAMNIINNLAAPDDPTCTDATLEIKSTTYNQLTAEEIAIATAKNWAVISA